MHWTAPSSDGGAPITGYIVTPFADGYMLSARTFQSTDTAQTVTGLQNGTAYTFMVAAINSVGAAEDSYNQSDSATPLAWLPFGSAAALVKRVYADVRGRAPTSSELATAENGLTVGSITQGALVASLLTSGDALTIVAPVTRLVRDCIEPIPERSVLMSYLQSARGGKSLSALANQCVTTSGYQKRYGGLSDSGFVKAVFAAALGAPATNSMVQPYVQKLQAKKITRAGVVSEISASQPSQTAQAHAVTVIDLHDLLLHQTPSAQVFASDVKSLDGGESLTAYASKLMASPAFIDTVTG